MSKEDMEAIQKKIEKGKRAEKRKKKKEIKKQIKAEKISFWADFKKFITKGNVIDMAVAVVVGSAFSAITNGLVKFIINPCIAYLTKDVSLSDFKTPIIEDVIDAATGEVITPGIYILWGDWIQTIIQFFIIAISIFTVLRIIKGVNDKLRIKQLAAEKEAAEKKKAADAAAAAAAAAVAAEKEAQLQQFYANVARQTELLEKLANNK